MSAYDRAGAVCLVTAPVVGLISVLVGSPVSGRPADLAHDFVERASATQLGLALNALAAALLVGGLIWWAAALHRRTSRAAGIGGILGVIGMFGVLCDDAIHTAGLAMVSGMNVTDAANALQPLASGIPFAVGPLSELGGLGVIILAIATVRAGLPVWAAAATGVGVVVEGIGFATGFAYLPAAGFAISAVGYAVVAATMTTLRVLRHTPPIGLRQSA